MTLVVLAERLNDPASVAVPERLTICGDPDALSVMLRDPVRLPNVVGVNVTVIVQFPETATVAQVFVCVKELAFVPVTATALMIRGAVPLFETVTVCVAADEPTVVLAKVRDEGETPAIGVGTTPVPVRAIECGEPAALSTMLTAAVNKPPA